ncbi:dynamin family protein [Paenibacillus provencensis]|uniref:Dynamin family protein n=1 Tax=Paenibacillus provencensis TaxID=441151 RepID=A0ABW3PSA9_9BACL|nr:dynamin family protein [Paenibacillus sp. MER 78]MCM3126622.1 dynamin family protein [Paenibacillus sp. MER 78]
MLTSVKRQNDDLRMRLQDLQKLFLDHEDSKAAASIADLQGKAEAGELTLAFCGHFSAGKSSLINRLCGKKVLPSSPVPTSANVVVIRNGPRQAKIYRTAPRSNRVDSPDQPNHLGGASLGPITVSPDELDEYCKNGEQYAFIEVWEQVKLLQEQAVLLDTPGVDSTDGAHKQATDSALHLADAVFYVMDYNHVQSENNLSFAKSLSDWGKPLYLIVTQIDKHRDEELSFGEYRAAVEAAFKAWEVSYAGLLFTTLRKPEHPYNQLSVLPDVINELLSIRTELLNHSLASSAIHISKQFLMRFEDRSEERKAGLLTEIGGEEGAARLAARKEAIEQEMEAVRELPQLELKRIRDEVDRLLHNANLTPADVREAAGKYIESRRTGFKVGFLFSAGKTEQEKQERFNHFWSLFSKQAEGQAAFHLKTLLRQLGNAHGLWSEDWDRKLDEQLYSIEQALITSKSTPDGAVTGEYVLNYCKELRAELSARYRKSALEIAEQLLEGLTSRAADQLEVLKSELEALRKQSAAAEALAAIEQEIAAMSGAVQALLPAKDQLTAGALPAVPAPAVPEDLGTATAGITSASVNMADVIPASGREPRTRLAHAPLAARRHERLAAAAAGLTQAAALAAPYAAMKSAVRGLTARAASLAGGTFTLALFGAFSAGKSSFANALLGEAVLPVSPHPTTAAINRIMAPAEGAAHRTARVTMKTRDALWQDLAFSFDLLGLGKAEENSWREKVAALTPQQVHPAGRPHYSFLKAAAAGYDEAEPRLGSAWIASMDEYRAYVAEEKKSCFVDSIDLYYNCELTEQGIILVDTPGADSINARHTGVTFNYMKNADALVFVTYYNHAFSQGDRQFLNQLGRVKDAKSLDNMFFVINAADLASSEEELGMVKEHVTNQLQHNGVRVPKVYPVSSLLALQAKQQGDEAALEASRFTAFERAFSHFAGDELPDLAIHAASKEVGHVRQRVEQWIRDARQGEAERLARKQKLTEIKQHGLELLSAYGSSNKDAEIAQEMKELLFHVGQRISYRMSEFMSEAFHPSVLREDQGDLKGIFLASGRELLRMLYLEIEQELLATTLRMESKGQRLTQEEAERTSRRLAEISDGIQVYSEASGHWDTPTLRRTDVREPIAWKNVWKYFKNPKHFFEGPGRKQLQALLEPELKALLLQELEYNEEHLITYFQKLTRASLLDHQERMEEQWSEEIAGLIGALEYASDIHTLEELASRLTHVEDSLI